MKKWKYKVEDPQWEVSWEVSWEVEEKLNRLGQNGWELVSVINYTAGSNSYNKYFFKREVKEEK